MSLNMYPCYDKYKKRFMEMVLVRYSIMFAEIFLYQEIQIISMLNI